MCGDNGKACPPHPTSQSTHLLPNKPTKTNADVTDQSIACNGTITPPVAQPADFYTRSQTLCGFASCTMPNQSDVIACCATPMQSHGLYRFCEPRTTYDGPKHWEDLLDDWVDCLLLSPAHNITDGGYGIGCNRVPGALSAGHMLVPNVWMVFSLVSLILYWK